MRYREVPPDVVEGDPEFPEEEKGPGVRYILCYNPERAEEEAPSREKTLAEAERELQVVTAYKNLFGVERAMREIKDFLKLRPIYHYNADRVRAHVLICVLAYLFEQWFEVLSRRKVAAEVAQAAAIPDPEERKRAVERAKASLLTGRRMVEILNRIKAVEQVFAGKRVVSVTRPGPEQREVLSILGVTPPPALLLPD